MKYQFKIIAVTGSVITQSNDWNKILNIFLDKELGYQLITDKAVYTRTDDGVTINKRMGITQ